MHSKGLHLFDVSSGPWYQAYFREPLLDLGNCDAPAFRGVLTPASEIGRERKGVNAVFLENAEAYYAKYQGFAYWRTLLLQTLERIDVSRADLVVEYGCGFGNATLPMLDILPSAKIIASDISPNLLAILHGLLESRGLQDRCVAVAMDAQKPLIREGGADLVFGAAILHHLAEPDKFIRTALEVVKPGGAVFFFEPLEGGLAILRLICEEVLREAKRQSYVGRWTQAMRLTNDFANDLRPQIFRSATSGWCDRDDKWAFPRSVLDRMARENNAELQIYGLHDNVGQFRRHFSYMLETYGGMRASDYPAWAWEIFDHYDKDAFSPEMLLDLALEGCIIFRKPLAARPDLGVD
jgi:SAM-dependent methyltransferase